MTPSEIVNTSLCSQTEKCCQHVTTCRPQSSFRAELGWRVAATFRGVETSQTHLNTVSFIDAPPAQCGVIKAALNSKPVSSGVNWNKVGVCGDFCRTMNPNYHLIRMCLTEHLNTTQVGGRKTLNPHHPVSADSIEKVQTSTDPV